MPPEPLTGIRACVFDAYGTLFDFASAAEACRDRLGPRTAEVAARWRDKQLQYTWLRGLQGRHADFWQVTGDALDQVLETLGRDEPALAEPALRRRLIDLYLTLQAFPEVPDTLGRLKQAGFRLAILSNGTAAMLRAAVAGAGLESLFEALLSVDEVGVYKPHPSVYRLAVERLGLAPEQIAFQSSNAWDAHAASAFGFRVVWCNRYGQPRERLPGAPDREISTLAELPALLGA